VQRVYVQIVNNVKLAEVVSLVYSLLASKGDAKSPRVYGYVCLNKLKKYGFILKHIFSLISN
jgi:hypothetical protein